MLSLRTRLVLAVSLVVALVLGLESVLEIRLFEQAAERDLRETGLVTGEAVVDDLELRQAPWVAAELDEGLREFARSVPSIRAISVVRLAGGVPEVVASTASSESDAAVALARETLLSGEQGWRDDGALTRLALKTTPVGGGGPAAVVVTISLASIAQLRTRGRLVSLWLVPLAIVVLTLVLDQVLRRLVYRPIAAIRETMARAGAGDLAARVEVARTDEMGEVATGLNQMLARLADFNQALEERIRAVTSALDVSHAERIDSYQRMLALREALAEAERLAAAGQTAASVAHQVGTPLNLISGHVQLLLANPDVAPDVSRRLLVVREQIERVADAVRGMLERVHRPGPLSAIDVAELLASICDLVRPRLVVCRVRLDEHIDRGLPAVQGDRNELELALLNLISNAIDAMPDGGDLRIEASAGQDGMTIVLQDSGSGISPAVLPRIFEPWVTTKPPGRGTGLGLSITRDVIARMGGTITAEAAPERGTIFTVTLPSGHGEPTPHADAAHR
jgi:two-component system, NtrC family, sensor kinase